MAGERRIKNPLDSLLSEMSVNGRLVPSSDWLSENTVRSHKAPRVVTHNIRRFSSATNEPAECIKKLIGGQRLSHFDVKCSDGEARKNAAVALNAASALLCFAMKGPKKSAPTWEKEGWWAAVRSLGGSAITCYPTCAPRLRHRTHCPRTLRTATPPL